MQPLADHHCRYVIKLWKEGFKKTDISKISRVSLRSVIRIIKRWQQTEEGMNFSRQPRGRV